MYKNVAFLLLPDFLLAIRERGSLHNQTRVLAEIGKSSNSKTSDPQLLTPLLDPNPDLHFR